MQPSYAGFWIRALATFIDAFFLWLILIPLALILPGEQTIGSFPNILVNWIIPAVIVLLFWRYKYATPGKMVFGLKIADARTLGPPDTSSLIIRYVAYFASLIPFGLGYLWVSWDSKKQGWHDKIAGTVVTAPADPQRRSKIVKIIAGILIAIFLLFLAGLGAGYFWFRQNKDRLKAEFTTAAERVMAEADQFGTSHTDRETLEEAFRRYGECEGFICQTENLVFLKTALGKSRPTEGFCDGVPAPTDFLNSVTWRVARCQDRGVSDNYCPKLFGEIQDHCHQNS